MENKAYLASACLGIFVILAGGATASATTYAKQSGQSCFITDASGNSVNGTYENALTLANNSTSARYANCPHQWVSTANYTHAVINGKTSSYDQTVGACIYRMGITAGTFSIINPSSCVSPGYNQNYLCSWNNVSLNNTFTFQLYMGRGYKLFGTQADY